MAGAAAEKRLIGREPELTRLDGILRGLSNRSAFVELVGEPGIGKTELLDALARRADQRGFLVLRGRAAQFEQDVPFQVFVDALDDYLGSLNPRLLEPLSEAASAELAGVFPALADLAGERRWGPDTERYRAHHAVRSLLELLAARKALLVQIDDLHWADEASQELLSFLLRRQPRGPMFICLAYRVGQAPPRLVGVMRRAVAEGACEHVELGPLAEPEARQLLGEELSSQVRDTLYRESGGNPFYLEQLARTRLPRRRPLPGADAAGGTPASVLASIEEELQGLDPAARAFLDGAAVAGDPFDLDLACAAADLEEAEALSALDFLLDRDLVRTSGAPRSFRFRHPIVRRAVYDNASPGWRLTAHRRAAEALASSRAAAVERAHHVEHSAKPGDQRAVELLREAGTEAMGRAPAAAAHWFEAALRLLPGDRSDRQRLGLLLPLAVSLGSTGRLEESRNALRDVLAVLQPSAIRERVNAAVACAMVENFLSRHEEARELLLGTLRDAPAEAVGERAALHLALANLGALSNDWREVESQARQALAVVSAAGDPAIESAATSLLALQPVRLGKLAEAPALIDRAASLADSLTDAQLAEHLETLAWLFTVELFAERIEASIRHSERAVGVARATGQSHLLPLLMMGRNWSISFQGRLAEAEAGWQEMLEICLLTGNSEFEAWALTGQTMVATESGDWKRGAVLAERTVQASRECRGEQVVAYAHVYPARLFVELGEVQEARRLLLEGGGGPELEQIERVWRVMSWAYLARCEIADGDLAGAEGWTQRAEELAEELVLPGRLGWALTARAHVQLARGEPRAAAETALRAAAESATGGFRVDAARARLLAGHALAQAQDPRRATRELQRAHAELGEMGSVRYRDEAARALRVLGVRVARPGRRGRAGAGVDALSQREREVAELVAEGRTNREIAHALYIAEKTVEKRLSRIFEKLDVSGRAAVGAILAQGNPEGPTR